MRKTKFEKQRISQEVFFSCTAFFGNQKEWSCSVTNKSVRVLYPSFTSTLSYRVTLLLKNKLFVK